ncbi:hypothetical protein AtubIFM55763_008736 [Aspergillus tubingensis]|uniref:Cyanovirin-N domain-containing protein n=1 Tax=Aspergillus tubingensis TaxID=5068 RepID=A0A8H3T0H7_ASPTU|nr:uncharacterized protein AtWU_08359 [Aspergillus tubingensis]GFN18556.1 hypothetical protein AtWU_08359 [Aspergillus tubingensis]GLA65509.1 hypothetical protein AtubIFM54640_007692 [Aspergillus tubingensis]GLA76858.1 hypothetical protein AtubIFM55763_008736 [Aspergillus tubingensis]GLA79497.1 hypothetical protein AtubIFM56815_000293 [Aspergillus tubingensis]GLA91365.1 hypothetical protein AtubIFM57143_003387 [Aspergillus tubingensis]
MSDSVGHRIKDDSLEGKSLLHYKGLKSDDTWTEDQTIDLNNYFGDSDGWFTADNSGYAERAEDADEIREYVTAARPSEPKLRAHLYRDDNKTTRFQGVTLDDFFEVDDDGILERVY